MKKSLTNSFKLILDPLSENESFARCTVAAFASPLNPTLEDIADIRTVVSEAVTNSIVHGYREKSGKIYINVYIYDDRSMKIVIKDKGCGIGDLEKAMQPLYTTDTSGERGGMGFSIMKSFTDKMRVISVPGRGTSVTMIKKFK